jgi:hypothetical protein
LADERGAKTSWLQKENHYRAAASDTVDAHSGPCIRVRMRTSLIASCSHGSSLAYNRTTLWRTQRALSNESHGGCDWDGLSGTRSGQICRAKASNWLHALSSPVHLLCACLPVPSPLPVLCLCLCCRCLRLQLAAPVSSQQQPHTRGAKQRRRSRGRN